MIEKIENIEKSNLNALYSTEINSKKDIVKAILNALSEEIENENKKISN